MRCVCARATIVCAAETKEKKLILSMQKAANKLFRRYCSGAVADGEQKRQIANVNRLFARPNFCFHYATNEKYEFTQTQIYEVPTHGHSNWKVLSSDLCVCVV